MIINECIGILYIYNAHCHPLTHQTEINLISTNLSMLTPWTPWLQYLLWKPKMDTFDEWNGLRMRQFKTQINW